MQIFFFLGKGGGGVNKMFYGRCKSGEYVNNF